MNPSGRDHGSGRRGARHVDSNDRSGSSAPSSSNWTYDRDARPSSARSTRITPGGLVDLVEIEPRDREQQTAGERARGHWARYEGHVTRGTIQDADIIEIEPRRTHDADIIEVEPRGTHRANIVPSSPPPAESGFWNDNRNGLWNLLDDIEEIERYGPLSPSLAQFGRTLDDLLFVNGRAWLRDNRSQLDDAMRTVEASLAFLQGQAPVPSAAAESSISRLPKIKLDASKLDSDGTTNCGICLQSFGLGHEVMELPCQHWYCEQCIRTWLGQHDSCPQCRRGIMPPSTATEDDLLVQDDLSAPEPQRISRRHITRLLAPYLTEEERQMIIQAHDRRRPAYMQETTVPPPPRFDRSQSNVPGRLFPNDPPHRPRSDDRDVWAPPLRSDDDYSRRGIDPPANSAEDGLTDVEREIIADMEREDRAREREGRGGL